MKTNTDPRTLDARVAEEIMGWKEGNDFWERGFTGTSIKQLICHLDIDCKGVWEPSNDLQQCYRMETRLAEMGLEGVYYGNLLGMISEVFKGRYLEFGIVHADPLQKVQAALRAVEGRK